MSLVIMEQPLNNDITEPKADELCNHAKATFRNVITTNIEKYVELSANISSESREDLRTKISSFISGKDFDIFYSEFTDIICSLDEEHLKTSDLQKLRADAAQFFSCFAQLKVHGFYDGKGVGLNFWSGQEARKVAYSAPSYSDGKIPLISFAFSLSKTLLHVAPVNSIIKTLLYSYFIKVFSTMMASQATGDVTIYMSSDKQSEAPGLTVGNCFWDYELPTLQYLHQTGVVNRIFISFINHDNSLTPSRDLNEPSDDVPILMYRRKAYLSEQKDLEDAHPDCFKTIPQWADPKRYSEWAATSAARPSLSWNVLLKMAKKWQSNTIKS